MFNISLSSFVIVWCYKKGGDKERNRDNPHKRLFSTLKYITMYTSCKQPQVDKIMPFTSAPREKYINPFASVATPQQKYTNKS